MKVLIEICKVKEVNDYFFDSQYFFSKELIKLGP